MVFEDDLTDPTKKNTSHKKRVRCSNNAHQLCLDNLWNICGCSYPKQLHHLQECRELLESQIDSIEIEQIHNQFMFLGIPIDKTILKSILTLLITSFVSAIYYYSVRR